MIIKTFNKEYKKKGGMLMLNEMRALMRPQQEIANHFGVTSGRIVQWFEEFYGSGYDPRYDRRTAIVESMVDFSELHNKEEFNEAFKNSEYYERALMLTKYEK